MNEQKIIDKQLIKNMLLNLVAFTLIFSFLGIIIYTQVSSSLYSSSDNELVNNKNRIAIIQDVKNNVLNENLTDVPVNLPNITEVPKDDLNLNDDVNTNQETDSTTNIEINKQNNMKVNRNNSFANPRLVYIYRDENGNIIEDRGNYNHDYFSEVKFDKNVIDEIYDVTVNGEYKYRGINYKIEEDDGITKYVQVLINVDAEQTIIKDFTNTLVLSIVTCIALAIIASYVLSKKTLKPIVKSWKKQTEFVQNASHELRTPLTIIQAKQELLLEEPNKKVLDKAEDITICLKETRRLSKLVKDLMAIARADSNKIDLKKEKVNIDEIIKQVVEPFKEIADEENKQFLLDLNYKKDLNIDKSKIHQLLVILLDNAIKYTEKDDTIIIKTYEKDNKFVLQVIDTGIGISDEGLKYIFDRFYREDKARSRQTGGSGLGLSIAHFIVMQHKGTIKAFHNDNKGTKFEIKI